MPSSSTVASTSRKRPSKTRSLKASGVTKKPRPLGKSSLKLKEIILKRSKMNMKINKCVNDHSAVTYPVSSLSIKSFPELKIHGVGNPSRTSMITSIPTVGCREVAYEVTDHGTQPNCTQKGSHLQKFENHISLNSNHTRVQTKNNCNDVRSKRRNSPDHVAADHSKNQNRVSSSSTNFLFQPPPQLLEQAQTPSKFVAIAPLLNAGIVSHENGVGNEDGATEGENGYKEFKFFCNFEVIKEAAISAFKTPAPTSSDTMWFCSVLWDSEILREFQAHEQMEFQRLTRIAIVKLLTVSLRTERQSWPGISQMNWKIPFVVLNIISDAFATCGSHPCLRVQEVSAADTVSENTKPRLWDLIILPECQILAYEMVRLFQRGVKTTVIIWNAQEHPYPETWNGIEGEIILKPDLEGGLSVLIFHHETLDMDRARNIHSCFPKSELGHFQDPDCDLNHNPLVQVNIDEYTKQLYFHVQKKYRTQDTCKGSSSPICSFPDVKECEDAEEFICTSNEEYNSSYASVTSEGAKRQKFVDGNIRKSRRQHSFAPTGLTQNVLAEVWRDIVKLAIKLFSKADKISNADIEDKGDHQQEAGAKKPGASTGF